MEYPELQPECHSVTEHEGLHNKNFHRPGSVQSQVSNSFQISNIQHKLNKNGNYCNYWTKLGIYPRYFPLLSFVNMNLLLLKVKMPFFLFPSHFYLNPKYMDLYLFCILHNADKADL